MAHDVFISYTTADHKFADATCNRLEGHGIKCWIAYRDIPLGKSWPEAITEAIDECKVMVIIFSSSVQGSKQVVRELTKAAESQKDIVSVRIEDVAAKGTFSYYLTDLHWLDAMTPPIERHLDQLAEKLIALLMINPDAIPAKKTPTILINESVGNKPDASPGSSRRILGLLGIVGLLAILVYFAHSMMHPSVGSTIQAPPSGSISSLTVNPSQPSYAPSPKQSLFALNNELLDAIDSKQEKQVSIALASGASPNANYHQSTPLTLATTNGSTSIVDDLIKAGGNVNKSDPDGAIPLNQAAYFGDVKMVKDLIDAGASVNSKDSDNATPLDHAVKPDIKQLLIAHGGHR